MKITYIGHATLLLEIGGRRFLTDPNYEGALGRLLPRVSAPGVPIDRLPPLDAVLLTHAHADHLSFETLSQLPASVPVLAPPAVARWLRRRGYAQAEDLAPGDGAEIGGAVRVRAARARHAGARYAVDRWRGAANMYLLDYSLDGTNQSCFFAGDTALTAETHQLPADHCAAEGRPLDVALLPIGHAPWWKLNFRRGHLTCDDALALFERLGARYMIPYHWGTFDHVTSGAHDAVTRLRARLGAGHPAGGRVKIIEPGETFELPAEV